MISRASPESLARPSSFISRHGLPLDPNEASGRLIILISIFRHASGSKVRDGLEHTHGGEAGSAMNTGEQNVANAGLTR